MPLLLPWKKRSSASIIPNTKQPWIWSLPEGLLALVLPLRLSLLLSGVLCLLLWCRSLLQILHPLSALGHPQPQPTVDFSTESYHRVADSLEPLPGYCLDLCVRLGGTKNEIEFRAKRAWEAGLWARATLQGLVAKPRPTPKLPGPRNTIYIIVRAPSVSSPTRVDTAAEYFRLIPSFAGSESISHAFGSLAEARVYCAGVGIALPEPR